MSEPLTDVQIGRLSDKYQRERDRFAKMAAVVARRLSTQLRASGIPHISTFRPKDPDSLQRKLTEDRERHEYRRLEHEFAPSLKDLAGVRIMLYRPQDVEPTLDVIADLFRVESERNFHDPLRYRARHRIVSLFDDTISSDPDFVNLTGVMCEVQVVTFEDHIYAELEHDITYKPPTGGASPDQVDSLGILRRRLNAVRESVDFLMEATDRQRLDTLVTIASPDDLRVLLKWMIGRPPRGDFDLLLRLLVAMVQEPPTRAQLEGLLVDSAHLDAGGARLDAAGITDHDDVGRVVAALWDSFDFRGVAPTWQGRPGRLPRLLDRLLQGALEGTM